MSKEGREYPQDPTKPPRIIPIEDEKGPTTRSPVIKRILNPKAEVSEVDARPLTVIKSFTDIVQRLGKTKDYTEYVYLSAGKRHSLRIKVNILFAYSCIKVFKWGSTCARTINSEMKWLFFVQYVSDVQRKYAVPVPIDLSIFLQGGDQIDFKFSFNANLFADFSINEIEILQQKYGPLPKFLEDLTNTTLLEVSNAYYIMLLEKEPVNNVVDIYEKINMLRNARRANVMNQMHNPVRTIN